MHRVRIGLIVWLAVNVLTANAALASGNPSATLISMYVKTINDGNWSAIPRLWVTDQREMLINFFGDSYNHRNKQGLFNIKRAKLMAYKQIPYAYGRLNLPRYIESFQDPEIYYAAVDYEVYREDKYHINGVNYFLIVTVSQSGQRKIALTPHVQVTRLIADGYGFGTADEKSYDERRLRFVH